jgi:4-hydroxy-3-methylbut-2-en-1-yl diphosphate reductase
MVPGFQSDRSRVPRIILTTNNCGQNMDIILAAPRGFCAGVNMAIESLDLAIRHFGTPIYVYHEIVHNQYVVHTFREKGAVFVDSLEEVPPGATVLFSAHGVSPEIRRIAAARKLFAIDATCPLVTKVHLEAIKYAKGGYTIILIGHEGHDEVIGTMGEAPEAIVLVEDTDDVDRLEFAPETKLAYLTQTTLSVDDAMRIIGRLRERFPWIESPPKEDICYATQNRQEAVRTLAREADKVVVLGSQNSSNSQRLRELAQELQRPSYLIDGPQDIDPTWFSADDTVLITAGASAPESVVQATVSWLVERFGATVGQRVIRQEEVLFPLPKPLRDVARAAASNPAPQKSAP